MPVTVCSVLRWLISVVYCVLYRLLFYSWIIVILKKLKRDLNGLLKNPSAIWFQFVPSPRLEEVT